MKTQLFPKPVIKHFYETTVKKKKIQEGNADPEFTSDFGYCDLSEGILKTQYLCSERHASRSTNEAKVPWEKAAFDQKTCVIMICRWNMTQDGKENLHSSIS